MTLSERLSEYVRACFTGLWIQSFEHEDALAEIAQLCRQEDWRIATWDVDRGLQFPGQTGQSADAGGSDPLAAIRSINALARARWLGTSGPFQLPSISEFGRDRAGPRQPDHRRQAAADVPRDSVARRADSHRT